MCVRYLASIQSLIWNHFLKVKQGHISTSRNKIYLKADFIYPSRGAFEWEKDTSLKIKTYDKRKISLCHCDMQTLYTLSCVKTVFKSPKPKSIAI